IDLVDEAASRLAMELESVPTEIDEVQRRLRQLELAHRQLQDETEESAADQRAVIEDEMNDLKRKLAGLREQWEAEKMSVGDVQQVRKEYEQAELEFGRLDTQIKEKQSAGVFPTEDDYRKLYELDVKRRNFKKRIDADEQAAEKADKADKKKEA